jgi:phosphonatase-like hydrolase
MDASALRIDLVVFGVEGTTVRSGDAVDECMRAALIAAHVPVRRESMSEVSGMPIPVAIRGLVSRSIGPDGATDDLVREVHADFLHRITDHYRRGPRIELMPHVEETFFRLKRAGALVALASAHSRIVLDVLLDRLGWRNTWQIDATVAADEVGRGRPQPDLIFRAMALTGVRRVEMVTSVGDTPFDLEAGAAAGCGLVVGVMNGTHKAHQLRHSQHTHLISHLGVLPRLVIGRGLISVSSGEPMHVPLQSLQTCRLDGR